jgi:hypothetical protein
MMFYSTVSLATSLHRRMSYGDERYRTEDDDMNEQINSTVRCADSQMATPDGKNEYILSKHSASHTP